MDSRRGHLGVLILTGPPGVGKTTVAGLLVLEGIVIPRWTLGTIREVLDARGVRPPTRCCGPRDECAGRVHEREGDPDLFQPAVLAAISSEFDDLGEFERHPIDVAGMDAEHAAAARLEGGELAL